MKIIKEKQSSRGVVSSFSRDALEEFSPAPVIEIDGLESEEEAQPILEDLSHRDLEQLRADVLAQAEAEAEQLRAQAREEGYEAGYAAGQEAFHTETATALDALQEALARVEAHYETYIAHTTPEVCDLVAHIAQAVVRREAAIDSELIHRIVDKGLRQIGEAPGVTIHFHPDDRTALEALIAQAPESHPGIGAIQMIANPEITRGGAILDTAELHLDARIERLMQEFLQILEH